ncbi:hypothetical protein [Hymenobacter jejuensis]|uniref:Lipoprotein n=2 Tax=Hymenobacter TaxID=89966 RepID=A0A5B8A187_9BACT|nr:hypothetical protein [Hymenobacter jejuensis]QDA61141.1 hypothetical protein FHG12_13975 [Hymenobacter jejuensis]
MKVVRLLFLLSFAAAFGACSSNSSSDNANSSTAGQTGASEPPKNISAAYDSAVADSSTAVVNADSAKRGKEPIPHNVPAEEYAAPARKTPTSANPAPANK